MAEAGGGATWRALAFWRRWVARMPGGAALVVGGSGARRRAAWLARAAARRIVGTAAPLAPGRVFVYLSRGDFAACFPTALPRSPTASAQHRRSKRAYSANSTFRAYERPRALPFRTGTCGAAAGKADAAPGRKALGASVRYHERTGLSPRFPTAAVYVGITRMLDGTRGPKNRGRRAR